jgi:hypothetical protein
MRLNPFDPFFQILKMRSGPVDLAATMATAELIVMDFRKWLEVLNDFGLGCVLQLGVTAKTARKWSDQLDEVKTAEDLDCLSIPGLGPRTISVLNNRMHE